MDFNPKTLSQWTPFVENRIFNSAPLYIKVRKQKDTDTDLKTNIHGYMPEVTKENLVSDICDVENGKILFTTAILNGPAISTILPKKYETRSLEYASRTKHSVYRKFVCEKWDEYLVIREFRFHFRGFTEGESRAYVEIQRLYFSNKKLYRETINSVYDLTNKAGWLARQSEYANYIPNKYISDDAIEYLKEKKFRCDYIAVQTILSRFALAVKSTRIFKNVPDFIKEDLNISREQRKKMVYIESDDKTAGAFVIATQDERVYFCSNGKEYRFGYNKIDNCWASFATNKKNFNMYKPFYYNDDAYAFTPKKTSFTELNKLNLSKSKYLPVRAIHMMFNNPLYEKIVKIGVAQNPNKPCDWYVRVANVIEEENKNLSVSDFFGLPQKDVNEILSWSDFPFNITYIQGIRNSDININQRIKCYDPASVYWQLYHYYREIITHQDETISQQRINYLLKFPGAKNADTARLAADYISILPKSDKFRNLIEAPLLPRYPKKKDLHRLHDTVYEEANMYDSYKSKKEIERLDKQITKFVLSEEFQNLLYENDEYVLTYPKCCKDLSDEGDYLHHCVGQYGKRVAKKKSYIFFLRKKADFDTPYFTIEINKSNKQYIMSQCYTFHDSTKKEDSCQQFLYDWGEKKNITIPFATMHGRDWR